MNTQLMLKPSSLMQGIKMKEFGNIYLFAFASDLQAKLEKLLEKKKTDLLNSEEEAELAGILELQRIFTFINAQLASQAKWCPLNPDNWFDDEPDSSANTATLQNT
ncbi:MAG: hypothetical protein GDA56_08240 [Hormoscilla sp. GM7CHS1pb]|nr:hypothetical protein [Hormoscilla sp. GM7CHS1pb]